MTRLALLPVEPHNTPPGGGGLPPADYDVAVDHERRMWVTAGGLWIRGELIVPPTSPLLDEIDFDELARWNREAKA